MASLKTHYKACVYKDKAKYHYLTNVTIAKEIHIKRDQLEHVNDSTKYFAQQGHGNSYWQGIEIIANDKKELEKTIVKDTKTIIEFVGYTSGKIKLNDTVKTELKWTKTEINKRTNILISEIIKMLKYSYENDPK